MSSSERVLYNHLKITVESFLMTFFGRIIDCLFCIS